MKMPLALALLILGLVLLLIGLDSAGAIQNAFSRLFSGQFGDHTVWLIVGGLLCFVAGLFGCHHSRRI